MADASGQATPEHATDEQATDDEGYTGPATLVVAGEEITVEVLLTARNEPFDGRLHWSGRVREHERVTTLLDGGTGTAELRTPGHTATGTLSDPDTWGRYRISGIGRPPFALDEMPPPGSD
ncbi:DUF4873 domain-containing protein [Pseudonocardia phyllosphaerae]|uniref:DUF4873 domain-containing protein n=1 Tax=Pseudonocardia phyllosphaerae TaxID=3390502 RepID=UPI00397C2C8B